MASNLPSTTDFNIYYRENRRKIWNRLLGQNTIEGNHPRYGFSIEKKKKRLEEDNAIQKTNMKYNHPLPLCFWLTFAQKILLASTHPFRE